MAVAGGWVFTDAADACLFTLLEEWDLIAAHQIHIGRLVTSGACAGIVAHLANDPVSHHYKRR
ncbi:quinol monooxygenase YgiN [Janthinobacterium sp. CG_S6]|nr:quinol monooxygenase YgiN [Janthinobacterium sp. CG_S6]